MGEFKACALNRFAVRALEDSDGRPTASVSVVPDVLEEYPWENVAAINPDADALARETGRDVSVRVPMDRFSAQLSGNPFVDQLADMLVDRQGGLDLWMFESKADLDLIRRPGVRLVGPDPKLVAAMNDKIWQYQTMGEVVPVVDFAICEGADDLSRTTQRMRGRGWERIFVTCNYSAGGAASMVTASQEDVCARFNDPKGRYLASRYVPHEFDPTILAVADGHGGVYVAGVADQRIEDGNKFRGSTYPSVLPPDIQNDLAEHTRAVGRVLSERGFAGIFGCDFIVDENGNSFFVEVNPRKQGTTMEFCCALERLLPKDAPSLFHLERMAVDGLAFPDGLCEIPPAKIGSAPLHWGTYNLKVDQDTVTAHALPREMPEPELFARVAGGGPGGFLILEHVGADVLVRPGTFLGRVAAVGGHREEMLSQLARGERTLRDSIILP